MNITTIGRGMIGGGSDDASPRPSRDDGGPWAAGLAAFGIAVAIGRDVD